MARLGVNVDHVATLRQARGTDYPDPVRAAEISVKLGVSCVTVHLREDRRHIQDVDVRRIRAIRGCRLNLEMAPAEEMIQIAFKTRPDQVTLVPERREELTTEGGLDVSAKPEFFKILNKRFRGKGIPVSLFVDPETAQIEASAQTGAEAVELNTAEYSEAKTKKDSAVALAKVKKAARLAKSLGLAVHAGHGLNYDNVGPVAAIKILEELNIGHSVVSRAVFDGFAPSVREMMRLIKSAGKGKR
ncbi:MAG: pyridoxine 5'-phosphate synthase [Nitrospinae bacterium]|nr:pyridoxine 5'-phosphate synthase [Nitrospinota bacterium]